MLLDGDGACAALLATLSADALAGLTTPPSPPPP
jgi:hypothetical protein